MTKRVDFYFDLSSPYSYLAATQIEAIAASEQATVRWTPVVLFGVFKATGNVMPAQCQAKAKWMLGDLHRFAQRYGVPFRWTSRFPVNAMKAHRMIVAAERASGAGATLARAFFDALWVDDRDLGDDATLSAIASAVGLDGTALLAAVETSEVKDVLRANTDEAITLGMFGAPAFVVAGELFWGNDRLDFVRAALASG